MDAINVIFNQLGVDSTIVHQFVVVFVFFLIFKFTLFSKLQAVIENRIEKTSKTESDAEKLMDEANRMEDQYKKRIDEVYKVTRSSVQKERAEFLKKKADELKNSEMEIQSFVDSTKKSFSEELGQQRKQVFSEVAQLSQDLVQKLTRK